MVAVAHVSGSRRNWTVSGRFVAAIRCMCERTLTINCLTHGALLKENSRGIHLPYMRNEGQHFHYVQQGVGIKALTVKAWRDDHLEENPLRRKQVSSAGHVICLFIVDSSLVLLISRNTCSTAQIQKIKVNYVTGINID